MKICKGATFDDVFEFESEVGVGGNCFGMAGYRAVYFQPPRDRCYRGIPWSTWPEDLQKHTFVQEGERAQRRCHRRIPMEHVAVAECGEGARTCAIRGVWSATRCSSVCSRSELTAAHTTVSSCKHTHTQSSRQQTANNICKNVDSVVSNLLQDLEKTSRLEGEREKKHMAGPRTISLAMPLRSPPVTRLTLSSCSILLYMCIQCVNI